VTVQELVIALSNHPLDKEVFFVHAESGTTFNLRDVFSVNVNDSIIKFLDGELFDSKNTDAVLISSK